MSVDGVDMVFMGREKHDRLSAQHTVIGANPSRGNALSDRDGDQGVWVAGLALSVAPATAVADACFSTRARMASSAVSSWGS